MRCCARSAVGEALSPARPVTTANYLFGELQGAAKDVYIVAIPEHSRPMEKSTLEARGAAAI
jgi:hypothetical protein